MDFETQTDIIILLENVRCGTSDSSCQTQSFIALAEVLDFGEDYQNYFREAGGVTEITKRLLDDEFELTVLPAALFCLATAIVDNEISKEDVLSRGFFLRLHQLFVSLEDQKCLQSVAFLLACVIGDNIKAQHLAYRTGCVEDLLQILRRIIQDKCIDETFWKMITKSMCACISKPQNENNQRVSSCMIPHLLKVITDWSDESIVQHAMTTIGLIMSNNASNQKLFKSCGGIDTLSCLISRLGATKLEVDTTRGRDMLMAALKTVDLAVADNEINAAHAVSVGLMQQVISLLQDKKICSIDMTLPLMVLAHIMELLDLSVDSSSVTMCQNLLTKLLMNTEILQDDENLKMMKYILSVCKGLEHESNNKKEPRSRRKDNSHDRSNLLQDVIVEEEELQPSIRINREKSTANHLDDVDNSGYEQGQTLLTNFNEVNKFASGIQNDSSEFPAMLAVMALQDKQAQVFSQIQNLISTLMPPNQDEIAPPPLHQSIVENSRHSPTHPATNSGTLLQQSLAMQPSLPNRCKHPNVPQSEKGGFIERVQKQNLSHCKSLQNVSLYSNAIRCKSRKGNFFEEDGNQPSKQLSPSNIRMTYNQRMNSVKSNHFNPKTPVSTRSNSFISLPARCHSNYSGTQNKDLDYHGFKNIPSKRNTTDARPGMKVIENNRRMKNGNNFSYNENDSGDEEDNRTIMSSSTVDYTRSLFSDLDKTVCSPKTTSYHSHKRHLGSGEEGRKNDLTSGRKYHVKVQSKTSLEQHSLSNNPSVRDFNALKDKSFYNQSQKGPALEIHKLCHDGNVMVSNDKKAIQNIRKVKAISSIELTSEADIFEENSSCLHLSSSSQRCLAKQNQSIDKSSDLHKSFQSAVRDLLTDDRDVSPRDETDRDLGKRSNFVDQEKPRQAENIKMSQDRDSGFGHDSNHDMEKKDYCKQRGLLENRCKSVNLQNKIRSGRRTGFDQQLSNLKIVPNRKNSDGKAPCHSMPEEFKAEEKKDNLVVPSPYSFTPKPLQGFSRNIRKRMALTSMKEGKEVTTRSLCSEFKKPFDIDVKKQNIKEEKAKSSKENGNQIVKEDKDVYHFTSDSEMPAYPSSCKTDISPRSIVRTMGKRSQQQKDRGSRRPRVSYSDQEILNLRHGVATQGTRWQQILAIYQFHPSRTAVDLKDKFKRLMEPNKPKSKKQNEKCETLPFSSDEIRRLTRGVKMFGHNWKAILAGEKFLPGRTHQDLRNKWTTISRKLLKECSGI